MQLRTVQDTIYNPNGSRAASKLVTFTLVGSSFTATELVMPATYEVVTNAQGVFSINLWCNDEGEAPTLWSAKLPDGSTFRFILEAGTGAITLHELRTSAEAYKSNHGALFALLDARYAHVGADGDVTDHGQLTGRTDDDHPQYLNTARGDARYSQLVHAHTGYASTGHAHDTRYYTKADADALFLTATDIDAAKGPPGDTGPQGVSITGAAVNGSGHLILTLSNATMADAGLVVGEDGEQGIPGTDGAAGTSVTGAAINGSGHLILTLSTGATVDAGVSAGAPGQPGADGDAGPAGVSVTGASINGSGHLILTLSAGGPIDAGVAKGAPGEQGPAGTTDYNALLNVPATFPPSAHTHDDRYYTETEVDTALAGKASSTHNHAGVYQPAGSYLTAADMTAHEQAADPHPGYLTEAEGDAQYATTDHTHPGGGSVSYATSAQPLGVSAPGTSDAVSRGDHVHAMPTAGDVGAAAVGHTHTGVYQPAGSYADAVHTHDDRYFTESEVTTSLAGKSDTGHNHDAAYSATGHTHDTRYYTEGEMDTALAGKSATTHDHAGVYQPAGSYAAASHSHAIADLPVAASGVSDATKVARSDDSRLSDARTPTTHTHDDRYFTESEVTTSLAGKSDTTHNHTGTYAPASHAHAIADLPVAASGVSDATKVTRSDDARLSDARTPTTHNHDTLYFTEAEVTTALAGKSDTSHNHDGAYAAASHEHVVTDISDYVFPPLAMSFSQNGDIYFVAHAAMTLATPVEAGTGTLSYAIAQSGAPTSFSAASFPQDMTAGDILKVTLTGITGYKATTMGRIA